MTSRKRGIKSFVRGTAIRMVAKLNINTATTATIKIEDPSEIAKANNVSMTKEADKIYSYVWQSATTDIWGTYVVTITITSGGYTSITQELFELLEED